jgi:hypothetical protein
VESRAWHRAFANLHLKPRVDSVGSDPLLVVEPPR